MPKKCYTDIDVPVNQECPYDVDEIQGKECLSDSLDYINNNFFVLDDASCKMTPEVYKHLKVKTEYVEPLSGTGRAIFLPENANCSVGGACDTFVLNFSGEGVNVIDSGALKTISIPITGVVGIKAGRNVALSATYLTNDGDIAGRYTPVLAGDIARGDVVINAILPDSPRQIRTLFYFGPTPATNPGTKTKNLVAGVPNVSLVRNFVNSQLNIPAIDNADPLFNGGDVYVIYQLNGLLSYKAQNAATYNVSFGYDWYIKIIGSGEVGGHENFTNSGSSNEDWSYKSVTNFIVWVFSREKGQSSYSLINVYPLQNLSQIDTSGTWLRPQTWSQY